MRKIINRFSAVFARERFLAGTVTATVALYTLNLVGKYLCGLYSLLLLDTVFVLCILFLYAAYRRHNKNVQKGLLGAILMWYLYDEVNYAVDNILFNREAFTRYDNFYGHGYLMMSLVTVVLFAALFVNHFIINSDHHSRPVNVFLNQLLVLVIATLSLLSAVFQCVVVTGDFPSVFEAITWHVGLAAFVLMLAAYESRFDAYKLRREQKAP